MSTRRSIAIIAGLLSTALLVVSMTSCGTGDIVYHPPCEPKDGGTDGGGGNGGNCP